MRDIRLEDIELSFDETYHIYKGKPLYSKRFKKVMSFHSPGLAAVEDYDGAYHIKLDGEPLYPERYLKTYGFYEGIATVVDKDGGYFHIDVKGKRIHNNVFEWAGNFQEKRCVVKDFDGYYHIKRDGSPAYSKKYNYVGDFKYGIAVAYTDEGYAIHIDRNGNRIHNGKFLELGVYHKGYAIARDEIGYFHIDKNGNPIYSKRYKYIEPFYNDYALVRDFEDNTFIINTYGEVIRTIICDNNNSIQKVVKRNLKRKLVGYWDTQIIYSLVKLNVFDAIKNGANTYNKLKEMLNIPDESLHLIIDYLRVHNYISTSSDCDTSQPIFSLTYKGELLSENPKGLKYAALMWGAEEHYITMSKLTEALKSYSPQFENIYGMGFFDYINNNKEYREVYKRALGEYSLDYDGIVENLKDFGFDSIDKIMDVGGGSGALLSKILDYFPNIKTAYLFDLPNVIEDVKHTPPNEKINYIKGNFFEFIPSLSDTVIISRVIHDWSDESVLKLLNNLHDSLPKNGRAIIIETVVPENVEYDLGISLNFNLLVMVGGKERRLSEFKKLFELSNFKLNRVKHFGLMSIIEIVK